MRGLDAVPRADRGDSAKAAITIDARKHRICWTFSSVKGLGGLARPRIGKGPSGTRGSIVVTLAKRLVMRGCSTQPTTLALAILRHPSAYFVVLTNQDHPDGAVRSQL